MNYSELTQAILDMSSENDDTTFVDNVPIFIRNAEKRIYQAVKIPDFRKNKTSLCETGNEYITLPTDYLSPWEFSVDSDGTKYLLLKDVSFIREAYPSRTYTSVPKYYAQYDSNTFLLGPTPASTYTVQLHYFYYPASIVDASTSWLGDNFDNLLLYASMLEAASFMKSEQDIVRLYNEQYAVNFKLLQDYSGGKLRSGDYR